MTSLSSQQSQLTSPPCYSITIQACPSQFLKSIQTLKKMGILTTLFELSFKSISQIQLFTRILNREQDEQRVANELKLTYFHNVRGKVKRKSITRNEDFQTMKRIRFNSAYHVTLFVKYFEDRIKQLENEYSYTLTSGKDGYFHVYLDNDDNVSSMFLNEIRDMKKKLNFLEVKDEELCEKFIYSEQLGQQLKKIGIFHEIWYRGRQSTMIFYSEKQTLPKMKTLVHTISKYHITIMKMADEKFSFLLNYLLFKLLKKSFYPEIKNMETVDTNQVEFSENKLGFVIHDKHEIFSTEIVEEILNKMKDFMFLTLRANNARGFFNSLKKNYSFEEAITFCYSKKTVCLCINIKKIKTFDDIREIFGHVAEWISHESMITFNWFHLQDESLKEHRRAMIDRMIVILSSSGFHIENFEMFIQNKALKCILRFKNVSKELSVLSQYVAKLLTDIAKAWNGKEIMKQEIQLQANSEQHQDKTKQLAVNQEKDNSDSQQNDSENASQYDNQQNNEGQVKLQQNQEKPTSIPPHQGLKVQNQFTIQLDNYMKQTEPKYYESSTELQWKQGKSWRKAEELLSNETNIVARVKHICINQTFAEKITEVRKRLLLNQSHAQIVLYPYQSYSLMMFESPFYRPETYKPITTFDDVLVQHKYLVCYQMKRQGEMISYPMCSMEVMRKV